ncbi:hypothetical protein PVK64_18175 [Aliivibrio sp. S4TY2]|nr:MULTISPECIES: hypothetical protein [unclassified Aliivibrio]MDD9158092.1 hypothetical protein [Aliivibrio sp. S4TY2]MDD9162007.1 hypothetical protein [Aliivibrio sp. S4TY1]MDD9166089.1 hypothetical protein [Aliivibrio sp. S4MY2]MDD9170087.1 hypothetical protein [Aliivibrio sp. S4MY4]MDD9187107.1 hypothetical protein [Aliivibrio sp. S4MY3]
MNMTQTEMREGHKPRTERVDKHAKQRIDDKWYQWQLRKINENALM